MDAHEPVSHRPSDPADELSLSEEVAKAAKAIREKGRRRKNRATGEPVQVPPWRDYKTMVKRGCREKRYGAALDRVVPLAVLPDYVRGLAEAVDRIIDRDLGI